MSNPNRYDKLPGDTDDDLGLLDVLSAARTTPWPTIHHYYGSVARQLLLAGSALMLLSSPIYGDSVWFEFPFEVIGAIAAVGFGALTTPHTKWASIGDAIIAGAGTIIFAGWGILG